MSVRFDCYSITSIEWTFENGPLPKNVVRGKESEDHFYSLKIRKVTLKNEGKYVCNSGSIIVGEGTLIVNGNGSYNFH